MGRRALAAGAAAALLLCAPPAVAQQRPELDGPSQSEMNRQAATRYRMADEALNAVYAEMMSAASQDGRKRLRTAQRAWITFRDLDCKARAGSRGGSFYPASLSLCLERATDERTRTLQAELDCAEGDLACGGHRE